MRTGDRSVVIIRTIKPPMLVEMVITGSSLLLTFCYARVKRATAQQIIPLMFCVFSPILQNCLM
jgi:hypothetical protein